MGAILKFLIDIASTPAVLIAFISALGLFLQNKNGTDILNGSIKTFVGFLVVSGGASLIVSSLSPFGLMFQEAFNVAGVVPNNEAIVAVALEKFGASTALIMLFGMAFNILFARITRFKYIYLTGHVMLYIACMIAVILSTAGLSGFFLVVFGGVLLGLCNTLFPAILQKYTVLITKQENIALGHSGNFGYLTSALIGEKFGDKSKSTEDINFPKNLSFLRDSTIAITLTMSIIYLIVAIFAGSEFVEGKLSGGNNYLVFALVQAGSFAAGVYIILAGVRMIIAEIVPAFKGISEKLVPNAKASLDCPIVFTYAPNAVLIGFISSFIGGIVSLILMAIFGMTIILPGVVPHFFCGATAGVYGNATGGVKGAVVGSFVHGVLISFMPLLLMPALGSLGFEGSTFSDTDYGVIGIFLSLFSHLGAFMTSIAIIALTAFVIYFSKFLDQKKIGFYQWLKTCKCCCNGCK
jgi:PTS system ascorbate-specific IIC component